MPILTRDDLKNQLRRRDIAPVYVLYGAETYLRDKAVKTITEFVFAESDFRDFNESDFSLNNEESLQRALAAAQQMPMMATRRVVRIHDVRITLSGFRDTVNEGHEAILAAFLSSPSPHAVVIFIADEINRVRKVGKLLTTNTVAVDFQPLDDREFYAWAKKEVQDSGATIDESALRRIVGLVGSDVRRLTNEIHKLATAALPSTVITADLVNSLVPNSREISNFDLTDQLVAGRRSEALATLGKILDDGAEPLALLGLISYNYRRLLMANEMMSKGVDRREVANVVKLRYSDQEPFLAAARRANPEKLVSAICRLANTDLAIKTSIGGGGTPGARMQLEMLVCELAVM